MSHQGTTFYVIPYLYQLDSRLDTDKLCRAIETAVEAHPTLWTRITLDEQGEPMQEIKVEKLTVSVEPYDGNGFERFVKPFNIIDNRLFRIHLLKDDQHHYLILDIHHIINDGTSLQVLLHDIEAAYQGNTLEPETFTGQSSL